RLPTLPFAIDSAGNPTLHEQMRTLLREGEIVGTTANAQHGRSPSDILTIRQTHGKSTVDAIAKSHGFERELAASYIAEELGGDLVPPTTLRVINGKVHSVQLMVDGTVLRASHFVMPFNRQSNEVFRLFDLIIGNHDRHDQNVLVYDEA